jgi:YbgC/YbaW family acyl-CoA thioester hydrolase
MPHPDSSSWFTYRVQASECDAYHHLNHASCFQILEKARWNYLAQGNRRKEDVIAESLVPVIIHIEADFRREIREGDQISISTSALSLNRRFFEIHQEVLRGDQSCVRARFKHGLIDLASRRLVEIPSSWASIFA